MNPTQTGIAVAVALAVVLFFFLFGGMSYFTSPAPSNEKVDFATTTVTNTNASTTMPTENVTQLQITDLTVGTGAAAAAGESVTVKYVGAFTNGTVFDASANHTETASGFTFTLGAGQVIKGWDEGVVGMKVGGKRKLVVPASLGYGAQDYGPIPGNSTLIFEIELMKVKKP